MLNAVPRKLCKRLSIATVLLFCLSLQACYYLQAANGQLEIWRKQRPIDAVISDPQTSESLADRLRLLQTAREFATSEMLLPDNGSYREYADLERDFVLWNVVAAPEFSLQPQEWCYLFVGCLAYRGYFEQEDAQHYANELHDDGMDVFVAGVPAYSTLGRFSDPLLNTMMNRGDAELISLLFHELAHQKLYIDDATAFNESFASAVAEFGLRSWYERQGDTLPAERLREYQETTAALMLLVDDTRRELEALYAGALPDAEKRRRKQVLLNRLGDELQTAWGDDWTGEQLNNARLATLSLYRGYLPEFRALFARCDRDWSCFYASVDRLAGLSPAARADALAELVNGAP